MNKFQWVLVASGLGLIGGIYLSNTQQKNLALTVGVGSGGALFGGGLVAAFYQHKTKKLTADFEQKVATISSERDKFKNNLEALQRVHRETCQLKDKTLLEVESLKNQIKIFDNSLKDYQWRSEKDKEQIIEQKTTVLNLSHKVEKLEEIIANKDAALKEFELNYEQDLAEDVEVAFQKKASEVIEKEIAIDSEITAEAIELMGDMKAFLDEIMDRHQDNRDLLLETNSKAKSHIVNLVNTKNEAYNALLAEKQELELHKKILQQQLDGELISPEKAVGKYGWNWVIANSLVDAIWEKYQIPLKITGLDESLPDGSSVIGFGYSKSANPNGIIAIINQNGKEWAKIRGIYFIGNARLSPRYPAIEVTIRREKPVTETTDGVYASGLIPAEKLGDSLYRALTHGNKGKPTLRVMASTGDGKGITLKNLLAYWLTLDTDWDVWLSDPVNGSDEDHWDCDKVAINQTEARQAYDKFYQIYQGRKSKKLPTTPKLLAVFDEFDSEHTEEQHEQAKEVMGRIRHVGMHQILVGQSAEVGKNGWTWDDMKNCALLVLEGSIGTLRKHLVPDLGWSLQKKNKLGKEYDKYRKWADDWNEANPDVPVENQKRIGLLIVGDSYQFLETPMAHKGILRSTNNVTIQNIDYAALTVKNTTVTEKDDLAPTNSSQNTLLQSNDPLTMVSCPYCGSVNVVKQGPNSKGQQYYSCKDCQHKPRKWVF